MRGLLFAVMLFAAMLVGCGSSQLDAGRAAYEAGDLPAAVAAFESIEEPSAAAHYNAGIARYRQDDMPRAIAHWRAARQLAPRNGDVAHNLALARSRLKGTAPSPVAAQVGWLAFVTAGELGLLAFLLLAGASGGAWFWRRRGRHGTTALGTSIAGLVLALLALHGDRQLATRPIAVVVDTPAVVRDAAAVHGAEIYELAPGSELQVEKALGDFLLIRTGDQRGGWIPRDAAVLIVPGYPSADQETEWRVLSR